MYEIFAVANIVGGTIVIPHTRRAAEYWEELMNKEQGMLNDEVEALAILKLPDLT
jgi:hypothetical protein